MKSIFKSPRKACFRLFCFLGVVFCFKCGIFNSRNKAIIKKVVIMFKQVYFFVLSVIFLLLSLFLACTGDNNVFGVFVVSFASLVFVVLQVFVFVVLPSFKGEK